MSALSHVKSNPIGDFTGTVTAFNSQGSTVTVNATDIVRPSDWNSAHNVFQTISGNTAGQSTMSGTNLVFQGGNNLTLSLSTAAGAATMVMSAANQSVQTQASGNIVGAGFTSTSTAGVLIVGTLNSQGLSVGVPNWLTTQTVQTQASGAIAGSGFTSTTTAGSVPVATLNSAGLSIGVPQWLTTQSVQTQASGNIAGAGFTSTTTAGTALVGTLNSAGLSVGVPIFVTNALTTARASNDAIGLNTAKTNVTWTVNSSGLSLDASGYAGTGTSATNASITLNSNGLAISVAAPGAGGGVAVAAGTQTGTSGTIVFSNSNGITFGMSGSTQVTASYNSTQFAGIGTSITGNASITLDSNGIKFNGSGLAGTTTAITGNALITMNSSGFRLDGSGLAGTSTGFTGANISGSMTHNSSGLALSLSVAAPGGAASATLYATGNTTQSSTGTMALSSMIVQGTGGVSAGISNGSIVISGPTLTSLSVTGALSASSNGSTISLGVGTVTASGTSNTTQGSSGTLNLNALIFAGAGAASVGITNGSVVISAPNAGAGNVTFSAGAASAGLASIVFSNSNGVSFGLNGSTITASAAGGGGGGIGGGVSTMGNTAGSTGTVTTGNIVFVGSGPISLSQSTGAAGSAATITINAPATSSLVGTNGVNVSTNGSTISLQLMTRTGYDPFGMAAAVVFGNPGQGTLAFIPVDDPPNFQYDRIVLPVQISNATNSSFSATVSVLFGIYTLNASTLSLITSTSQSFAFTASGTVGSYSLWGGPRLMTIPLTSTHSRQDYVIGIVNRTTTGGGAGMTINMGLQSQVNSNFSGILGAASNATNQSRIGLGVYTASTSGIPSSVGISQINGTASLAIRPPLFYFTSGTI